MRCIVEGLVGEQGRGIVVGLVNRSWTEVWGHCIVVEPAVGLERCIVGELERCIVVVVVGPERCIVGELVNHSWIGGRVRCIVVEPVVGLEHYIVVEQEHCTAGEPAGELGHYIVVELLVGQGRCTPLDFPGPYFPPCNG